MRLPICPECEHLMHSTEQSVPMFWRGIFLINYKFKCNCGMKGSSVNDLFIFSRRFLFNRKFYIFEYDNDTNETIYITKKKVCQKFFGYVSVDRFKELRAFI